MFDRDWSWVLWNATVKVPENNGNFQIAVKATDAHYNTQPETAIGIWNLRGLLNNSWHRVNIVVEEED